MGGSFHFSMLVTAISDISQYIPINTNISNIYPNIYPTIYPNISMWYIYIGYSQWHIPITPAPKKSLGRPGSCTSNPLLHRCSAQLVPAHGGAGGEISHCRGGGRRSCAQGLEGCGPRKRMVWQCKNAAKMAWKRSGNYEIPEKDMIFEAEQMDLVSWTHLSLTDVCSHIQTYPHLVSSVRWQKSFVRFCVNEWSAV